VVVVRSDRGMELGEVLCASNDRTALFLTLVGLSALLIGGALLKATATGDVRHWEMLPRTTFIVPLILPPGKHNVSVSFNDGSGQTWRERA
jgi:hypothetical protein